MDTKNYCNLCCQITNHTILFTKEVTSSHVDDYRWVEKFQVIQCDGCENVLFRKQYSDEDTYYYDEDGENPIYYSNDICYPKYLKEHRVLKNQYEIPNKIRIVYLETIEAFKSACYLLAGVGLRAVIEAICIEENILGRNLEIKISNLLKNKLITEREANRLHSIRFLGNDSVHEMDVPSEKKIFIAL